MATVVTVLAGLGMVLSLTFVIIYAQRRWWESQTGRILMVTVGVLGVAFGLRFASRTWLSIPEWAFALAYLVLDAGLFGLLWLLLRSERPPPPNG